MEKTDKRKPVFLFPAEMEQMEEANTPRLLPVGHSVVIGEWETLLAHNVLYHFLDQSPPYWLILKTRTRKKCFTFWAISAAWTFIDEHRICMKRYKDFYLTEPFLYPLIDPNTANSAG